MGNVAIPPRTAHANPHAHHHSDAYQHAGHFHPHCDGIPYLWAKPHARHPDGNPHIYPHSNAIPNRHADRHPYYNGHALPAADVYLYPLSHAGSAHLHAVGHADSALADIYQHHRPAHPHQYAQPDGNRNPNSLTFHYA